MNNLAVAVESFSSALDIALVSSGVESLACASLLAANGQRVELRGKDRQHPSAVKFERADRLDQIDTRPVQFTPRSRDDEGYVRSPDVLILHARAADYSEALNTVASEARPGQTIFLIDAPLMSVFELSERMQSVHNRAAVNVIETGQLFSSCRFTGQTIQVSGPATQISLCGRTVNETRAGLSLGRSFWKNLMPASNVFERRLVESGRILGAAQRLFAVMSAQGGKNCASKGQSSLTGAEQSILSAMTAELQSLGKHLNVSIPSDLSFEPLSESLDTEREELSLLVKQDLVLISELSKLAYVPVPTIDSIIELASVTLGKDLRKGSRTLADLGLIGMDFNEIFELVNA